MLDQKTRNVLIFSFGTFFIFGSYSPVQFLQTIVIQDAVTQTNGTFSADGYVSLSIVYFSMSAALWIAPVIVGLLESRLALIIGSTAYILYSASFLWLSTTLIYTAAGVLGIGGALFWTSRGAYMGLNSGPKNATRDSGIFMSFYTASTVISSLFCFFVLRGLTEITEDARRTLFLSFAGLCCFGTVVFCFLPTTDGRLCCSRIKKAKEREEEEEEEKEMRSRKSPWKELTRTLRLALTAEIFLVLPFAWNSGLLTAFSAIYVTCIGNTAAFGEDATSATGLAGITYALGRAMAAILVFAVGRSAFRDWRHLVVLLGEVVLLLTYVSIFLTFASDSPFRRTTAKSFLQPNLYLALFNNLEIGFGLAATDTSLMALILDFFNADSAHMFALFHFYQSVSAGVTFGYSRFMSLHWQLLIIAISACISCATFILLQSRMKTKRRADEANQAIKLHSSKLGDKETDPLL